MPSLFLMERPVGSDSPVFGEMLSRIRRAARNGTRLHLDPEHVNALCDDDIYALLSAREARELKASCQKDEGATIGSSLARSGYGIVPSATIGTSAGLTVVSHAADRQASEAARAIIHQSKRSKPLPTTTSRTSASANG